MAGVDIEREVTGLASKKGEREEILVNSLITKPDIKGMSTRR